VPYRSAAPAVADLLGGQLRPLAVTTAMRSEAVPDLPMLSEFVPGWTSPVAHRNQNAAGRSL
jgi:tripartite-type tricarboxylate transporter receptor subunit TctC